jgi:hypothetical protein
MRTLYTIDFDDTLNSTDKSNEKDYNPIFSTVDFCKDKDFVILTARKDTESNRRYISGFLKEVGLPYVKMYFTDRGPKGPVAKMFLDHSDIDKVILIDDNEEQRMSVKAEGMEAFHPMNIKQASNRMLYIKDMYLKVSTSSEDAYDFIESDLEKLFEKFVKEENYIGRGTNSMAYKHDNLVMLVPAHLTKRMNDDGFNAREYLTSNNDFSFINFSKSEDWMDSMPIASWGGKDQGQRIVIMKYLGENIGLEADYQNEYSAKVYMDKAFDLIKDSGKIEKALDKMKEIDKRGFAIDPKPDNLTIGVDGEINFIDLTKDHQAQEISDLAIMLVHPPSFRVYPKRESVKEVLRSFIDRIFAYGKSIGLADSVTSKERLLDLYGLANEDDLETIKTQNEEREKIREEERAKMLSANKRDDEDLNSRLKPILTFFHPGRIPEDFDLDSLSSLVPSDFFNIISDYSLKKVKAREGMKNIRLYLYDYKDDLDTLEKVISDYNLDKSSIKKSILSQFRKLSIKNIYKSASRPKFFKQNNDYINYSDDNIKYEFENELGNKITISGDSKKSEDGDYYYINLKIEGPNSTSENTITYMEAETLSKVLDEIL